MPSRTHHRIGIGGCLVAGALALALPGAGVIAQDSTFGGGAEPGTADGFMGDPPLEGGYGDTEPSGDGLSGQEDGGSWNGGSDSMPFDAPSEPEQMRTPFGDGLEPAPGTEPYEPPSYSTPMPEAGGQDDFGGPNDYNAQPWVPGGADAYPTPGAIGGGGGAPAMPQGDAPAPAGEAGSDQPGAVPDAEFGAPPGANPGTADDPSGAAGSPSAADAAPDAGAGQAREEPRNRSGHDAPSTESFHFGP